MSFVPALISGIGALGGLFGNRSKTTTSTSNTQGNYSGLNMPAFSAEGTGVLYPLADKYLQNLSQDTDLTGYRNAGVSNTNRLADIHKRAIEESMAARGVSGPAVGTALAGAEGQRIQGISQLDNSIPLLAQQIQQQKMQQGIDLFRTIPEGQSTTGQSNSGTQGSQTDPGNMLGGLFGNLGQMLAYFYGKGAFGGSGGGAPGMDTGIGTSHA